MKKLCFTLITSLLLCTKLTAGAGDSCAEAVAVSTGTHNSPQAPYWYKFTVTDSEKVLIISSVGLTTTDTYLEVYDACDGDMIASNDDYSDSQSRVTLFGLTPGETVYIYWADYYSSASFSWSLSVEEPVPGEDCMLPIQAELGTNQLPENTLSYFWYQYTMPVADAKIQITSSADASIYALSNSCQEFNVIASEYQQLTVFDVEEGQSIYIVWELYNGDGFSWELSLAEVMAGESCSTAIPAEDGTNTTPNVQEFWFQYEMPDTPSKLTITSSSEAYVTVLQNDCLEGEYYNNGFQNVTITNIPAGEIVLIRWELHEAGSFNWELSASPLAEGDDCSTALSVSEGAHTAPYAPFWYVYTVPASNKQVVISSVGHTTEDTYLAVFGDCEFDLIETSDDYAETTQSEVVLTGLEAGQTLYIYWLGEYSTASFDWQLTLKGLPELSITTTPITQSIVSGELKTQTIGFTNAGEGDLEFATSSSLGLLFDGIGDMVVIQENSDLDFRQGGTVAMWVYLTETIDCDGYNNWRYLFNKSPEVNPLEGYHAILEEDLTMTWSLGTEQGTLRYNGYGQPLPLNEWALVAFTYSAETSEAKIYMNGAEVAGEYWLEWPDHGGEVIASDYNFTLTASSSYECPPGFGTFPGYMDDLSIWNTALDQGEISKLMVQSPLGSESELEGYWDFEVVEDWSTEDKSQNANVAYVYGPRVSAGAPVAPWMSISPTEGTIAPGSSSEVEMVFDAAGLQPGNYQGKVVLITNDLQKPTVVVPVTLEVLNVLGVHKEPGLLQQNYPNPMRTGTTFQYYLKTQSTIDLALYNLNGQRVSTIYLGDQTKGHHEFYWNGVNENQHPVPNGLYLYKMVVTEGNSSNTAMRRLIIAR